MSTAKSNKRQVKRVNGASSALSELNAGGVMPAEEKVIKKFSLRNLMVNPFNSRPVEDYILNHIFEWIDKFELDSEQKLSSLVSTEDDFPLEKLVDIDLLIRETKRSRSIIEEVWKDVWLQAKSVQSTGITDPIKVFKSDSKATTIRSNNSKKHHIFHGHRRSLSAIVAGLKEIEGSVDYDTEMDAHSFYKQTMASNYLRAGHRKDVLAKIEEAQKCRAAYEEKYGKKPSVRELSDEYSLPKTHWSDISSLEQSLKDKRNTKGFKEALATGEISASTGAKIVSKTRSNPAAIDDLTKAVKEKGASILAVPKMVEMFTKKKGESGGDIEPSSVIKHSVEVMIDDSVDLKELLNKLSSLSEAIMIPRGKVHLSSIKDALEMICNE